MATLLSGVLGAVKNAIQGREFAETEPPAATQPPTTMEGIWSSLPKVNPRVMLGGNGYKGLVDLELIRNTGASWDPRGEHDAVKRLQNVTIPGYLVNDRNLTAAQQRAWNRDAQGLQPFQI